MIETKGKGLYFTMLIFLATLLLVGCQSQDDDEVTIELFNQKPEITQQLKDVANAFSKEYGDVRINVTTVGNGNGAAALQAKFISGDEPDMMMLGNLPDINHYSEYLYDMTDSSVKDIMIPKLLEGAMVDGRLLGIPMSIEGFGFMYNKSIFSKAGIDPEGIETYQDFVAAVESLDQQKEELGLDAVFGFSGADENITNHFSGNFTASEFNNNIIDAFEAKTIDWKNGERMKMYADLINKYNVQPLITLDYSQSVETLFVNDRVAMIHQGNWIVPTLNGLDPEFVKDKLGILPVFGDTDDEAKFVAGAPWYFTINKNSDQKVIEASEAFLSFLFDSETGLDHLVNKFNFVPPTKDFDANRIQDEPSQVLYEALMEEKNNDMTYKQAPYGYLKSSLHPEFQKYLSNRISWEEFEKNTKIDFESLRQVQNDHSSD